MITLKSQQKIGVDYRVFGKDNIMVRVYHDELKNRYYYTLADIDTLEEHFTSCVSSGEVESRMEAFKHMGVWYEEPEI